MPPEHFDDLSSTNALMSDQQRRSAVTVDHPGYRDCMPAIVPSRMPVSDIAQHSAQPADSRL
jgi:hypothetical protein